MPQVVERNYTVPYSSNFSPRTVLSCSNLWKVSYYFYKKIKRTNVEKSWSNGESMGCWINQDCWIPILKKKVDLVTLAYLPQPQFHLVQMEITPMWLLLVPVCMKWEKNKCLLSNICHSASAYLIFSFLLMEFSADVIIQ